jgi:beta-lactamase class A
MRLIPCRYRWWAPLLGLSLATPGSLLAQAKHADAGLTRALAELTRGFRGDVGIYVRHLRTGATAALRADERFPTASMIKVPIMATIFEGIAEGQLGYLDMAPPPRPVARDPGGDLVAGLADTARVEVGRLLTLSLTFSDNTASLWLEQLTGGGAGVNRWLEGHGFDSTRVNARTAGREAE